MSIESKPIDQITEEDLQELIEFERSEIKHLDYKRQLDIQTGDERKEFLYDIASFANTDGGHLIFGMDEEKGTPTEIVGFMIANADELQQQVNNLIRDNIEPQIYGLETEVISIHDGKSVLIIRVPPSWNTPHWVTYKGTNKFYGRNSKGKYQLDLPTLRQLFTLSSTAIERIRDFRTERIGKIYSGETPIPLADGAKIVLHIIPLSAMTTSNLVNLNIQKKPDPIPLIYQVPYRSSYRFNLDGLLCTWMPDANVRNIYPDASYTQIFRNGIIEALATGMINERTSNRQDDQNSIQVIKPTYEHLVREFIPKAIELEQELSLTPPFYLMLTFVGVEGQIIMSERLTNMAWSRQMQSIERDVVILPETMIDSTNYNVDQILRPIFDIVWNACGWERSFNYNEQGEWSPLSQYR